jgi:uncharacterized membrane protein YcaP (DUF421 family)
VAAQCSEVSSMLNDLFGPTGGQITTAQEVARAVLVFVYGLILVRLAGRRVFGKWAALDIIVSIILGSNLSRCLTGSAPLWGTFAASALLMILHWLLAMAAARSATLSHILEGRPVHLGQGGQLDAPGLQRHAVSEADIKEALRGVGLDDHSRSRLIILEPSGKISILKQS